MKRALLALVFASPLLGCESMELPGLDLERMIDQARYDAQEKSEFFADGRSLRTPPEGTVPRSRPLGYEEMLTGVKANPSTVVSLLPAGYVGGGFAATGVADEDYAQKIPVPVTAELLERGQVRFNIYCAVCHGTRGDGESRVAERMPHRKPPTLLSERAKKFPVGKVFQIISKGFGLMPSYAHDNSIEDRWAMTAYVRALQLSGGVSLDALPGEVREEALKSEGLRAEAGRP
jgi:mono/diheme cytochrome c family protein